MAAELARILAYNVHNISQLDLRQNPLGNAGIRALAESIAKSTTLVHLDLRSTEFSKEGADALFAGLVRNCSVTCLHLGNVKGLHRNYVPARGIEGLGNVLKESRLLTFLDLRGAGIGNEGLYYILDGIKVSRSLKVLNLSLNQITAVGSLLVVDVMSKSSVKQLDISENQLGNVFRSELYKYSLDQPFQLTQLSMCACGLASPGMQELFDALRKAPYLSKLELDDVKYDEYEFQQIKHFLSGNTALKSFSCRICALGDRGVKLIAEALAENLVLEELYLSGNKIGVLIYPKTKPRVVGQRSC